MIRNQIYLTEGQDRTLTGLGRRLRRSKSALIREAIEKTYMGQQTQAQLLAGLKASFAAWQQQESGKAYVERLRSGRLKNLHAR